MEQTRQILNLYYWIGFSVLFFVVGIIFSMSYFYYKLLFEKQQQFQDQLLQEIIKSKEEEQIRIARELHDGILGDIAALKIALDLQKKVSNSVDDKFWKSTDEQLKKIIQEVRTICHDLVPPMLDTVGLIPALQAVIEDKSNKTNKKIKLHLHFIPTLNVLDELHVFRLIQEWITNHLKHNQADCFNITFSSDHPSSWKITLEDNGDPFQWHQLLQQGKGMGWKNMHTRILALNGYFEQTAIDKGNQLNLIIPIK
jgi:two-component system NarL family sensor kinase